MIFCSYCLSKWNYIWFSCAANSGSLLYFYGTPLTNHLKQLVKISSGSGLKILRSSKYSCELKTRWVALQTFRKFVLFLQYSWHTMLFFSVVSLNRSIDLCSCFLASLLESQSLILVRKFSYWSTCLEIEENKAQNWNLCCVSLKEGQNGKSLEIYSPWGF